MKEFTEEDVTIDDVHLCLDCDSKTEAQINKEHDVHVSQDYVAVLVEKGIQTAVAKDILQHYQGEDGGEYNPQDALTEFYQHTKFHNEGQH